MANSFDYVGGFSEGLAMAVKNGKYGFINTKGEEVVECKFDFISTFHEGFAIFFNACKILTKVFKIIK